MGESFNESTSASDKPRGHNGWIVTYVFCRVGEVGDVVTKSLWLTGRDSAFERKTHEYG